MSVMSYIKSTLTIAVVYFAWQYYSANFPKTKEPPRVSGYFHPSFRKVADVFRRNVESGFERGAAFSVYYKGDVLVDMWGGWADVEIGRHWKDNTLTLTFSMVKGLVAVAVARLVDMGVLDYKEKVSHYWPEFGTDDKKNVTVEMLMSHQTGLIGLGEQISVFDYIENWAKVEKLLAENSPLWPPGTGAGYHAITYGMYADALVRKADLQHRNISQFFQEEIAKPLDLDLFIGFPLEQYHRFARIRAASMLEGRFKIMEFPTLFTHPLIPIANEVWDRHDKPESFSDPDVIATGVPSVLGGATARSLAKLFDFIANNGSLKAKRLLSPSTVELLVEPLTNDLPDKLFNVNFSRGLVISENEQSHTTAGHPGFGGNLVYADLDIGAGFAYTTNHLSLYMSGDPRHVSLTDAFYESFESYKAQNVHRRGI